MTDQPKPLSAEELPMRNIQTREGYDIWDKLCAIPRYGFLLAPEGNRVVKVEGIGNWIDQHAAQEVVDQAQDEINELRAEVRQLRADAETRTELSAQVHDLMHKGDNHGAHEMLHKALGVDNEAPEPSAPIAHRFGFDQAFRTACKKNGVRAAYVLLDDQSADGYARLLSGGDADVCQLVDRNMRAALTQGDKA